MSTKNPAPDFAKSPNSPALDWRSLMPTIVAGLLSWMVIALGFLGLKMLMQQRPEFTGQPVRFSKTELVQESPQVAIRKVSDDLSVIKPAQPEHSEVHFEMTGRRDYRGLRTIIDMSGEFRGRYVLTNAFAEPIFILFKCPHPRTASGHPQGLLASGLKLQSSVPGITENAETAWFWSGSIAAHQEAIIDLVYQVSSLKGVTYQVSEKGGRTVKQLSIVFHRNDLASMAFESGEGGIAATDDTVVWERTDFLAPDFFSAHIVEGRNLYASLSQLLEIGPLVCLLFLVAVSAIILARQRLTVLQMLTISAGFALYFPLMLYLSSRFSFAVALIIAVLVPGALLVNYARWLLGSVLGLLGGLVFLGLYQVFPTLAAFAGWNRGMVLLALGTVTLWVLINLQNQTLKQKAAVTAVLLLLAVPGAMRAGEIQVIVPAQLAETLLHPESNDRPPLISCEPAAYQIRQEAGYFIVQVTLPFQALRVGTEPVSLFDVPVYLQESHVESSTPDVARLIPVTNGLSLYVQKPGPGTLQCSYRVPIEFHEGKQRARIPMLRGTPGQVRLMSDRANLAISQGSLWARTETNHLSVYDIGTAGEGLLVVEWRGPEEGFARGAGSEASGAKEFYGIGITRAQNLTVINSDGSCTHFAEFEVPASPAEEFSLRLPAAARLISVSVNGIEIGSPTVEGQRCRIRLPDRSVRQTAHQLSFRIAYAPEVLGFVGQVELTLPEVFQSVGTLEWVVVLPRGFDTQVVSSGLEVQKTAPDLNQFGDYGRVLKSHSHIYLAKDLAPPGLVSLNLRYHQIIPGLRESNHEEQR